MPTKYDLIQSELRGLRSDFNKRFDDLKDDIIKPMGKEVKLNSEFRNKSMGIVAFVSTISMTVGGVIFWVLNKIGLIRFD